MEAYSWVFLLLTEPSPCLFSKSIHSAESIDGKTCGHDAVSRKILPKIQVASIGEIKAQSVYTLDQPAGAILRHSLAHLESVKNVSRKATNKCFQSTADPL